MSDSDVSEGSLSGKDDSDDEWVNDIVLVSKSGTRYPAVQALLVAKSPVFRNMLADCVLEKDEDGSPSNPDKVQLQDEDAEIRALVQHLQRPDHFLKAVIPELTEGGAQRLKSLTSIAFKYNMKGVLRQVQAYLSGRAEVFGCRLGSLGFFDTWLFACRYHLEDFLLEVEDLVLSQAKDMEAALTTASGHVLELPTDSQSVAIFSLIRMLQGMNKQLLTVGSKCKCAMDVLKRVQNGVGHYTLQDANRYLVDSVNLIEMPKR